MSATWVQAQQQTEPPAAPAAAEDVAQVLVVGSRASERSSIARKKNAPTAQDSIVADDVGSFPDRNVAEAISRISGVSLVRDEYGEGATLNIRGATPDQTRVEVDGMGVMGASGSSIDGNEPGRGVMLNEMPADLIASVDVVKGSTAAMTEGSLGGAVIIKTRTGLDFKKRTISLRASAGTNTLNNKWRPNLNLIFADQYLDGKLGFVANIAASKANNESHANTAFQGTGSPLHQIDFDQSPEKTWQYQPHTIRAGDTAANTPIRTFPGSAGNPAFATMTPREIVTRSAGAKTKADCYAQFPWHTTADLSKIGTAANQAQAQNQRALELSSCLNQWSDGTPYTIRRRISETDEDRKNIDLRWDYKFSRDFTAYLKLSKSNYVKEDNARLLSSGGDVGYGTLGTHYTDTSADIPGAPYRATTRTLIPNAEFYFFPAVTNKGVVNNVYQGMADGVVINVVPSSVKVDRSHNLVAYQVTNAFYGLDTLYTFQRSRAQTWTAGGTYRNGGFRAEFLAGGGKGDFYRYAYRTNLFYRAGVADVKLANGIVTVTPLNGENLMDPKNYSQLPATPSTAAGQVGQLRNTGTSLSLDGNIKLNETKENTLKADFTYSLSNQLPFLSRVQWGVNRRDQSATMWGVGGLFPVKSATATSPAVNLTNVRVTSPLTICENTPISLAPGGNPCVYGLSAPTPGSRSQINTVTQKEFEGFIAQVIRPANTTYFDGMKDKPEGLGAAWPIVDMKKLFALAKIPNLNPLDCIKRCQGTDGNMYDQPFSRIQEKLTTGYLSTDFTVDRVPFTAWSLPLGMEIEGNFGWRYVHANVSATTSTGLDVITPADPANPDPNGAVITTSVKRNESVTRSTTDIMPVLNLAWWVVPDKAVIRYNRAKVIARQPISQIYGSFTCINDFRAESRTVLEDDDGEIDMSCTGTVGNPALRPATNINHNLSLEWYPDADSVITVAAFRQLGKIGGVRGVRVYNARLFEGTDVTDPAGNRLADMEFTYNTRENAPANTRTGIEIGGKTAFSFLPSLLRYTGMSANYTRVRSKNIGGATFDPHTGDELPPWGQPKYSWNAALWYDDGALNLRAALQVSAAAFDFYGGGNALRNYYTYGQGGTTPVYDPGMALWRGATRYFDLKAGYKFKNGVELFAEGRNLGRFGTKLYAPSAVLESGVPTYNRLNYGGARYLVGVVVRH